MSAWDKHATLSELTLDVVARSSILNIVAHFWGKERLNAFAVCYKSMRMLDNLVDDVKERNAGMVPQAERGVLSARINTWIAALQAKQPLDGGQAALITQMGKFHVPIWPWESLSAAMHYDLSHNGYARYEDFLAYSEGAAVAPGAVFMHLCGAIEQGDTCLAPSYDIRETARPLALFCYVTHIIRDFQKDQRKGMNYFSTDLMEQSGLTAEDLVAIANTGSATPELRDMMTAYFTRAGEYRLASRAMLDQMRWGMEPRYILSLEVLFDLYQLIFSKIDLRNGNFTGQELNPTPEETRDCVKGTVHSFSL